MSAHDHHEGYICKIHTEKSEENKGLLLHEVSERVNEEHRSQVTHRSGHGDGRGRPVLTSGDFSPKEDVPIQRQRRAGTRHPAGSCLHKRRA